MRAVEQARERLSVLRREAAELLSLIDTSEYPEPTDPRGTESMPGPRWDVGPTPHGPRWRIHVCPEDAPNTVFIAERDSWGRRLYVPDGADVDALPIAEARRLAMSILAACACLDEHRTPQLRVESIDAD